MGIFKKIFSAVGSDKSISEDEFYNEDLIDFEVINSNEEILGLLVDIMETGAHDIYIVGEDEIMIPNVDEYVKKIDFDNKKIYVDVPQDLIDLNK